MKQNPRQLIRARQSGSAVLAALGLLAVSAVIVGAALFEARNRFRTSHHSGRWTQAAHAAEAGAELALMSAQKNSWTADGWPSAPAAPGTAAVVKTFTLSSGVPATGPINATVSADKITLAGAQWLRLRSSGQADVAGGAVAGVDAQDVMLRKLSLRRDRTAGSSVGAAPRATRTVEILAQPVFKSPYLRALLLDKKLNMSAVSSIDSFDSSDPRKSTNGQYVWSKRQSHGDIGVNDSQGLSNLRGNTIYGNLAYSGPTILNISGVTGTVTTPFSDPVTPVPKPDWTTFNPLPLVINTTSTLNGGTQTSPTRYKISSLDLSGSKVLTLAPHAAGQQSYVEIWVTGNFSTSGGSQIISQPGVHVTYHIEGNIAVTGSAFVNQSNIAANNVLNAVTQPVGTTRTVTVAGSGEFIGAINAPSYDFSINGSADFYGALIGKTMDFTSSANIHYDEALKNFTGSGSKLTYHVASWVEAVR